MYCSPGLVLDQELHGVAEAARGGDVERGQVVGVSHVNSASAVYVGLDFLLPIVRHRAVDVYPLMMIRLRRHGRSQAPLARQGRTAREQKGK